MMWIDQTPGQELLRTYKKKMLGSFDLFLGADGLSSSCVIALPPPPVRALVPSELIPRWFSSVEMTIFATGSFLLLLFRGVASKAEAEAHERRLMEQALEFTKDKQTLPKTYRGSLDMLHAEVSFPPRY